MGYSQVRMKQRGKRGVVKGKNDGGRRERGRRQTRMKKMDQKESGQGL
jgi:hypothetical protein